MSRNRNRILNAPKPPAPPAPDREMTAVEYLKEKMRLTDGCAIECSVCRLSNYNNGKRMDCEAFQLEYPEEAVSIVQNWAKERTAKTRMSDFLEKHPKAMMDQGQFTKHPSACACLVGYVDRCYRSSCEECWTRPLEVE